MFDVDVMMMFILEHFHAIMFYVGYTKSNYVVLEIVLAETEVSELQVCWTCDICTVYVTLIQRTEFASRDWMSRYY